MLIDWFTVGAQIVNFLILVWLLKHFLYKPILDAIDAREKRIAAELADADTKKAEAEKERTDFEDKNKTFDQQRIALLAKATDEAKAERERLIDQAKKDAESLRANQADALRGDQIRLGSEITLLAEKEVFAIARKTLTDLATVSLEERSWGSIHAPSAGIGSEGKRIARRRSQELVATGSGSQCIRSARRPEGCNSKRPQRDILSSGPDQIRRFAGRNLRHRINRQWPEGCVEHLELSH